MSMLSNKTTQNKDKSSENPRELLLKKCKKVCSLEAKYKGIMDGLRLKFNIFEELSLYKSVL